MSEIVLPALRGNRIVGFLAGLGVLQLVTEQLGDATARLCWPHGGRHGPVLRTQVASDVGSLADGLFGVVESMTRSGSIVPDVIGLPLRSEKSDPMNSLSFDDTRGLAATYQSDPVAADWLVSMVNLSAPGDAPSLGRSRWWAVGPGPVTIAGTLTKALQAVDSPAALLGALADWRRHDWVGGYLDVGADIGKERSAGSRPKDDVKAAVVGATWLALVATRWFPERARRVDASETVGWRVVDRRAVFRYPVWSTPLDAAAVRALLDHPAVWIDRPTAGRADLVALGVDELWQSARLRSGNNNAAVTHPERVWPTDG